MFKIIAYFFLIAAFSFMTGGVSGIVWKDRVETPVREKIKIESRMEAQEAIRSKYADEVETARIALEECEKAVTPKKKPKPKKDTAYSLGIPLSEPYQEEK